VIKSHTVRKLIRPPANDEPTALSEHVPFLRGRAAQRLHIQDATEIKLGQ
jgi:hypothetical protein